MLETSGWIAYLARHMRVIFRCNFAVQMFSHVFISKYIFFVFSLAISCGGVALLQPCGNLSSEAMHSVSVRYEMMLYSFEN